MRILLINDYATPTAGAEIMLLLLRDELKQRGHDVRVFATRAQLIPGESYADYTCFGTTTRWQVLTSTVNVSAWWNLRRVLRSFRPEMVHVKMFLWQLSPAIMPLLRNWPSLYHVVIYKAVCPLGSKMLPDGSLCTFRPGVACHAHGCLTWRSWAPMMVQRILFRRWRSVFDVFVANSEATRQRLLEDGVEPVRVMANGTPPRGQRPPLNGPPILAYAGRLSPEKGVGTLLRAFAGLQESVPEARLWVVGEGPEEGPLRSLASDLGISARVEFFGSMSRKDLEVQFDAAWVQIIPSLWEEPFGMVAVEALMRGTAVIASNAGGLRDIIRPNAGVLVPPGDVPALTEALHRLATNRNLCEQLGEMGRRIALAEYTAEAHADGIEAIYRSATGGFVRR